MRRTRASPSFRGLELSGAYKHDQRAEIFRLLAAFVNRANEKLGSVQQTSTGRHFPYFPPGLPRRHFRFIGSGHNRTFQNPRGIRKKKKKKKRARETYLKNITRKKERKKWGGTRGVQLDKSRALDARDIWMETVATAVITSTTRNFIYYIRLDLCMC